MHQHAHDHSTKSHKHTLVYKRTSRKEAQEQQRQEEGEDRRSGEFWAMEGLIPFVIDAIRKSHERSGYRCLSSDGSSHGGSGSKRQLIDYWELSGTAAAATADGGPRPAFVQTMDVRRTEEHSRPAAVAVGSAYRRK